MEMIERNPHLPWDCDRVCTNSNLTFKFVMNHLDKNLNWDMISGHDNITMNNIQNNPTLPWAINYINYNPNITIEFIRKYDFILDFGRLIHCSFTLQNRLNYISFMNIEFMNVKIMLNEDVIKVIASFIY